MSLVVRFGLMAMESEGNSARGASWSWSPLVFLDPPEGASICRSKIQRSMARNPKEATGTSEFGAKNKLLTSY